MGEQEIGMDMQLQERVIKAAVEYLAAQNRLVEATLLLKMPCTIAVSWEQWESSYAYAELKVEPGQLLSVREDLTDDRKKAMETALYEALTGCDDEVVGPLSKSVSKRGWP